MKYLKIEDNKGFFCIDGTAWKQIDIISKDDLLQLVDFAINGDFEMDAFVKEAISNQAHQIIYKNIYDKFIDLISKKSRFKDESEALYKEDIKKYTQA